MLLDFVKQREVIAVDNRQFVNACNLMNKATI